MPSPNNVLTADSYVQDGLVFQLDGIEYGGIDGQWIDRKGNMIFSGGASRSNNNSFEFDGQSNHLLLSQSGDITPLQNGQIDLIFYNEETETQQFLLVSMFGSGGYRCTNDGLFLFNTNGRDVSELPATKLLSLSKSFGIGNGKRLNLSTIPVNRNAIGGTTIGAFNYSGFYQFFVGKIFAIRVYSKVLKSREILINQKIDNARFQLGLNIPDEVLPATRSLSLSEPFELLDESMTEQDITNEPSYER